ncbi:MAG: DUF72 domain-containing protein [Desulfobacterales bacterium]|nr:DUF72 domain-containing protein [Desulfobacterales bacterium]
MSKLRIGSCSWKYPSWSGLVYSAPKNVNYLEEYAHAYETVEVDQWFWSLFGETKVKLPDPAHVEEYRDAAPEGFRFTVKAPNSITLTHFYKKKKGDPLTPNPYFLSLELLDRFLASLAPIRRLLGPLLFQFEYLNLQKMLSRKRFLQSLEAFARALPPAHEYAVEIRNANYMNRSWFEFLNRSRLGLVLLQGYWMPPITEVYRKHRSLVLEQETVVIRLHGPDRKKIEKAAGNRWDRIIAPRDEELAAVAAMVEDLLSHDVNVYVNVNNHYEGSAPLTIDRLRELLRGGV